MKRTIKNQNLNLLLMKRLILTIALSLFVVMGAYAQKKVLKNASKALRKGELQEAITLAEQAAQDPETGQDPDTYITLGQAYLKTFVNSEFNNYDAANKSLSWYEKAMEVGDEKTTEMLLEQPFFNPKDPTEYIGGGENLGLLEYYLITQFNDKLQNDDFEGAYELGVISSKINPSVEKAFFAGYAADNAGLKEEAYKAFNEVIAFNEAYDNLEYTFNYVIQYERNNDKFDEALETARKAQEMYPQAKVFKDWEVDLLIQSDRMDEAISGLQKIVDAGEADKVTYYTLGYLQWNNEQLSAAEESAKKALELDPDYLDALYVAGSVVFNQGAEIMREANAEVDDNDRYERLREQALTRFKEAQPMFEKCLATNPDDIYSLRPLSTIYDQLSMPDERDALLDRIDKIDSGN